MEIEYKQSPPHPDVSLAGNSLTVDGQTYNLKDEQQESEVIINVMDEQRFLANIILPPKTYKEVETGETDADGLPVTQLEEQSLDVGKVRLVIWKKHIESQYQEEV
jgi:hypothetical protein